MPYLTPDEVPEGTVCRPLFIPDDTAWLALVSGILTEATKIWNWQQFGTLTPQECVDVMQGIVDAYYASGCATCETPEGQPVTRLSELGTWQVLDNGDWGNPTGAYAIPTLPDIDAPTDEERRCLAALNAELVLHETYEQWTDAYGADLSLFDAIVTVAEWLTTRIGVWLGLLTAGQALIVFFIAEVFYDLLESVTADYWDTDFSEKMKCLLLYHAGNVGDTVVFDFKALREDLVLQTNWLDPTFNDIRLMGQIQFMLQVIGAEGLNHAGATTSITEPDCDFCDTVHCHEWTLSEGAVDNLSINFLGGSITANGAESALFFGTSQLLTVDFSWSSMVISSIDFGYHTGNVAAGGTRDWQVFDGATVVASGGLNTGAGNFGTGTIELDVVCDRIRIQIHNNGGASPNWVGTYLMRYAGDQAFNFDNCE